MLAHNMTNSFLIPLTIWHENNSQGCATPRFAGGDGVCSPHELWNTGSFHSKSHSSYWRHFGDFVMLYILIIVKRINAWLRVTHRAFFEASLSLLPPPPHVNRLFNHFWRRVERERASERWRKRGRRAESRDVWVVEWQFPQCIWNCQYFRLWQPAVRGSGRTMHWLTDGVL